MSSTGAGTGIVKSFRGTHSCGEDFAGTMYFAGRRTGNALVLAIRCNVNAVVLNYKTPA